jgi:hypothetical protein
MKTSELTGAALNWAVNHAERLTGILAPVNYCGKWEHGGPIIEREQISVIQLERESIPDAQGFWQGKYQAQWGAVIGERHSLEENHGSQGDYWGRSYHVDREAVIGPTPLIAAMRCYVASKLGDDVEIPEELK